MSVDRNSNLEQLEGTKLGEPEFGSSLVPRAHELYRKPLFEFTIEDLRLMIGQGLGLPFLIPLALEVLETEPLAEGDYHPGDLLLAVLRVRRDFWKEHQDLCWQLKELTANLPAIFAELKTSVEDFQKLCP
jgi:hypothetical protein